MSRAHKALVGFAVLAVGVLLAVATLAVIRYTDQRSQVADQFAECTLPGPKPLPHTGHACYDRGVAATASAIEQIELRQGCIAASLAHLPEPPRCVDVDRQLRANGMIPEGGTP